MKSDEGLKPKRKFNLNKGMFVWCKCRTIIGKQSVENCGKSMRRHLIAFIVVLSSCVILKWVNTFHMLNEIINYEFIKRIYQKNISYLHRKKLARNDVEQYGSDWKYFEFCNRWNRVLNTSFIVAVSTLREWEIPLLFLKSFNK